MITVEVSDVPLVRESYMENLKDVLQLSWEALQEAASLAGLQLRKLDKKTEKALVQVQRALLTERLRSEDEPAAALSLAVPLIVAQQVSKSILEEPYSGRY